MISQECKLYTYRAEVYNVYDGDTCKVIIDCGFGITVKKTLRLYGINTPELRGEEREKGLVSRDRLRELVLGKKVIIKTIKDKTGKYGRLLAEIYMDDQNINTLLLEEGLAVAYMK